MPSLLHRRDSYEKTYLQLLKEKAKTSKVYASYLENGKLCLMPTIPEGYWSEKAKKRPPSGISFNPSFNGQFRGASRPANA